MSKIDLFSFSPLLFYKIIAEYPAFQSGDECINENGYLLIGITWDADRDAPPFKEGRVHYLLFPDKNR